MDSCHTIYYFILVLNDFFGKSLELPGMAGVEMLTSEELN